MFSLFYAARSGTDDSWPMKVLWHKAAMKTRAFGRTGLEVSELVFGGGFVGGILIHADHDTKREALRRALAGGITWIDTAPSYGQGKSEEALGWLLDEVETVPRISTKVRLDTGRLDDIPGQIEASLRGSLARLRLDSVDLLQLHNPIEPQTAGDSIGIEQVLGRGGVAEGLEAVRARGLTRHIGLTALGDAASCRRAIESGRFESAQVYYNMLNPSAARDTAAGVPGHDFSGLIPACREAGVAVMAIRVLAAGVIATDRRHGREIVVATNSNVPDEEARARTALERLGLGQDDRTPYGTRAQAALRFVLANPDVDCAVVGLAELGHLDEALAAAELGPLPAEALARLDGLYS